MRKLLLLTIIFTMLLLSNIAWSQERAARVFYVNLYSEKVDVQLGEDDDMVFTMDALDPYAASRLLKTKNFGKHKLYFKLSGTKDWYFWSTDDGDPYFCNVETGKSYCIVVGTDGTIIYYYLEEKAGNGPRVCFFNGSDTTLTRMEVSKEWLGEGSDKSVAAYTDNIETNVITNFVTVPKNGQYSVFWQFPEQKKKDTWFFYPDKSGNKPEIFNFKDGDYYLFLAYTEGRTDYAVIYNVTP